MKTQTPIVLLRGKLGCPVAAMLAIPPSGIPEVLAWIPEEVVEGLLRAYSTLKVPREEELSFDAFREELLK